MLLLNCLRFRGDFAVLRVLSIYSETKGILPEDMQKPLEQALFGVGMQCRDYARLIVRGYFCRRRACSSTVRAGDS